MKCSQFSQELKSLRDTASRLIQELDQQPQSVEIDCAETITEIENLLESLRNRQTQSSPAPQAQTDQPSPSPDVYKQIVDSISDSLIVVDHHWRITYLNSAATKNTDFTIDGLIGRSLVDAIPAEGQRILKNRIEGSTDLHAPIQFEMQDKIDGKWYLVNAYPAGDGTVILGIDNTFRKIADAEREWFLSENKRQKAILNAIFEADPSGLAVLTGSDLTFAYYNPAYRFLTPDPMLDPIDQPYDVVWPKDSINNFKSDIETTLQTGKPYLTSGIEHRMPDGSICYFTVQLRRILWDHEIAVLMILWDVTDLKQAENSLRKAEQRIQAAHCEMVNEKNLAERNLARMQSIINNISDGLLVMDPERHIIFVNDVFKQMIGYDHLLNQHYESNNELIELIDSSGHPLEPQQWPIPRALRGEAIQNEKVVIRHIHENDVHKALINVSLIKGADETIEMVILTIRDISTQSQIEKQYQACQKNLETILDNTHDCYYAVDRNWRLIDTNRRVMEVTGVDLEARVGQTLWDVFPRWTGTPVETNLRTAMETQKPVHFSSRGMYSNRIYDISIYPNENGLSVIFNNFCEGELAMQALHASELRYSQLIEIANEGILTIDAGGVIDFINSFGAKTLGYRPEEMTGRPVDDFLHAEDRVPMQEFFDRPNPGFETQFELRLNHRAGQQVWSTVRLSPILTESGRYNGCLILFSDNTERREAEKALLDSEVRERRRAEEMAALMDTVPAMIWIARDSEAREMIGNRYGYEILRMWEGANISKTAPQTELVNQPYHNFKDGKEIPNEELPMQIAASRGIPTQDYEFDLVFNDGAKVTVFGNVNPIRDENGNPCGAVAAFVDVTKARQTEALTHEQVSRLEVQHRLLDQREQERLQVARELHDGPLQDLIAATYSFRETIALVNDEALSARLARIDALLHKLINDLRNTASNLRPPALTKMGLEMAMRMHAAEISEKNPSLKVDLQINLFGAPIPEAIRLVVFRIYQEALNNIIKHAQANRVLVQVHKEESQIKLKIQDNGIGFQPPADLNELVLQGHLGLVGMRERIEAVNGMMQISSQPGEGTILEAFVPLSEQPGANP
jgi:PAS domain S-box-containing protein